MLHDKKLFNYLRSAGHVKTKSGFLVPDPHEINNLHMILPGFPFGIVNSAGGGAEAVRIIWASGATMSRTTFDVFEQDGYAIVFDGDVFYSKPLRVLKDWHAGVLYIRRSANGGGGGNGGGGAAIGGRGAVVIMWGLGYHWPSNIAPLSDL